MRKLILKVKALTNIKVKKNFIYNEKKIQKIKSFVSSLLVYITKIKDILSIIYYLNNISRLAGKAQKAFKF